MHTNTNQYLALYGQGNDFSVKTYSDHDNYDKYWKFERYNDGSYKIINMYNNQCLEVKGGDKADGTDAIVNTDDGSDKQKWYIYNYNGNYVLKPACSECVLEVGAGNTADLANVQMGIFRGQTYQMFAINKVIPPQESEITPVTSDAIKFQLFNYTTDRTNNINKIGGLQSNDFRKLSNYFCFLSSGYGSAEYQNNWQTYDDIDFNPNHATVERELKDNYPVIDLTHNAKGESRGDGTNKGLTQEERSLAYLFGGESDNTAVQSYSPNNTILQTTVKDGVTHYYYSSRKVYLNAASENAVDYDIDSNEFRIRSYTDKNTTNYYEDSFLPFNSSYYNTETDGENIYHIITEPDFAFGMRMDVDFIQSVGGKLNNNQDMEFKFVGDDDIWVFIDDVLVLDLGGGHGPVQGSINFANGNVIARGYSNTYETTIKDCFEAVEKSYSVNSNGIFDDYTTHKLSLFYLERGGAGANCCMDFNMPTPPDKSIAVSKDVIDSNRNNLNSSDKTDYTFEIKHSNNTSLTGEELNYIFGTESKTLGSDGRFTLEGGQSVYFTNLSSDKEYKIKEITDDESYIKYIVKTTVSVDGGEPKTGTSITVKPAEITKTVSFVNTLNTTSLTVKKAVQNPDGKQLLSVPGAVYNFGLRVYDDSTAHGLYKFSISGEQLSGGYVIQNLPVGVSYQLWEYNPTDSSSNRYRDIPVFTDSTQTGEFNGKLVASSGLPGDSDGIIGTVGENQTLTVTNMLLSGNVMFEKTDDKQSVDVGTTVNYTITGKVHDTTGFTNYTYEIADTMDAGLTFNKDVKVTIGSTDVTGACSVTNTPSDDAATGFKLTIPVKNYTFGNAITVTYSAEVSKNVVATIQKNSATLTYSNDPTTNTTTTTASSAQVYSAKIVIDNYAADNTDRKLAGAEFYMYKLDSDNTTKLYYKADETTGVTWVDSQASATKKTTDNSGAASFDGIADGTYYLQEIKAPAGYNMLSASVEVTVNGKSATEADLSSLTVNQQIANNTGTELPISGGIGRIILFTVSATLAFTILIAAAIIFKKRRQTAFKPRYSNKPYNRHCY